MGDDENSVSKKTPGFDTIDFSGQQMMTDELMNLLSVKLSLATFLLSLATTSNFHLIWQPTMTEMSSFLQLKSYSKSIKSKHWSIFMCLYFVLRTPSQLIVEARFLAFD